MTKYEFVWTVEGRVLAGRERTDKIGPFEIVIASDRIIARTDFTSVPEAELSAAAAAFVENLARAIAFQEKTGNGSPRQRNADIRIWLG